MENKEDWIQTKLNRGIEEFQISALDYNEVSYLAMMIEHKGEKSVLNEILRGAVTDEDVSKRWFHIKTLIKKQLLHEFRERNSVVRYKYHSDLPKLMFEHFPYLFKKDYTPIPQKALVLQFPAKENSGKFEIRLGFQLQDLVLLRPDIPYKLIFKSDGQIATFEIETEI